MSERSGLASRRRACAEDRSSGHFPQAPGDECVRGAERAAVAPFLRPNGWLDKGDSRVAFFVRVSSLTGYEEIRSSARQLEKLDLSVGRTTIGSWTRRVRQLNA